MSTNGKRKTRSYTSEYKVEAVKLVHEIGNGRAAMELGVSKSTLSQWASMAKVGGIDTGAGTQSPERGMTQAAEIQQLRAENKAQAKKIRELEKTNAFLEEASAFFAASRQKSAREKE